MKENNITQKVYFDDDNRIVVESDHSTISNGEDHVDLKGEFIIRAEDVAKLLASHYKANIKVTNLLVAKDYIYQIISSHDIASLVDKQEECLRKAKNKVTNGNVNIKKPNPSQTSSIKTSQHSMLLVGSTSAN